MSTDKKWYVAINGIEEADPFADEESANRHAASRRGVRTETKAPDITKKIAVYQKGTARHEKARASGAAPKTETAAATPSPSSPADTEKKSEEPPAKGDPKKK